MGRIPQPFLDDLLARTDIVELIDNAIPLKKTGANLSACCPFHQEKSPSFTVSASKQFYHCFGCGAHGNAISFLIEYERLEFRDAVESLARSCGLEIPKEAQGDRREDDNLTKIYDALALSATLFSENLRNQPAAIEYLKGRELSGKTAKDFQLGFSQDAWDNCLSTCKKAGFTENTLLQAGLIIRNDQGKHYDRFRGRIMFPIRDKRARVIGFGGRVMDDTQPKYLNSPETPVFQKGHELYGLYEARKKHRHLQRILIVEGYMDVIALAEHGVDYAVATLGTATSGHHIESLFRQTTDIIFCFDGDKAGKQAAWRALENALPIMQDDKHLRFLFLPEGEDPDSFIRQQGKTAFVKACENATSFAEFLFATLSEKIDVQSVEGRAHLAKTAMAHISKLPDNLMFKRMLVSELGNVVRMDPQELLPTRDHAAPTAPRQGAPLVAPPGIMRNTITLLVQNPHLIEHVPENFAVSSLPGGELLLSITGILKSNPALSTAALVERFRYEDNSNIIASLAGTMHAAPAEGLAAEFTDSIHKLVNMQTEQTIENLMAKAAIAPGLTPSEKKELQTLIQTKNTAT